MNDRRDTRASVLRAARQLFAQHGYAGTSIRAITRRAGANLGAVTYHFGTKHELYVEVLTSVTDPLLERLVRVEAETLPPLDRIEALVRSVFEHFADHPDLASLLLHELSLHRLPPTPIRRILERIVSLVVRAVETGQTDGSIVKGDPKLLAMSVITQPMHLNLVRTPLREVVGLDLRDPATRAETADHAVRFVRRGLTATGRKP